jgi:hypothetical protein
LKKHVCKCLGKFSHRDKFATSINHSKKSDFCVCRPSRFFLVVTSKDIQMSAGKIDVYRIHTYGCGDNRFGVGREEEWEEKLVQSFDSIQLAQEYIKAESLKHTTVLNFLVDLPKSKWDAAIKDFCFDDDKYMVHRRFSIGPVNRPQLKLALQRHGVTVLPSFLKSVCK